jgi:hypothetical protein
MGGYSIDAAKAVYNQAQNIGMKNVFIGITPMVSKFMIFIRRLFI